MNNSYSDHNKLTEAKQMRKRADEDARLLANRIALLKQEELKARQKIEETRRKAQEITNLRNKHSELLKQKEEERRVKEQNEQQRLEDLKKNREMKQLRSQERLSGRQNRAFSEANSIKQSRKRNLLLIQNSKNENLQQKTALRDFIKAQKRDADERRRKMERERVERRRMETMRRVEEENKLRRLREEEIARMEQEEMELIQKLQNTQLMQKGAYEELENALAGPMVFGGVVEAK